MKKLVIRCLTLLLTLLLLPVLPACRGGIGGAHRLMLLDEETRAYELYGILSESLLDASAFAVTSTTTFSGRVEGKGLDITYTVDRVSRDQNGKGRMDYYASSYVTRHGGAYGEIDEYRTVSGYDDGYLFRSYDDNGVQHSAKTAIPYDEYFYEYARLSELIVLSPELWDCEGVTCLRNDDGSFTATFTGLNDLGLDDLDYDYGLDLSMMGYSIFLTEASFEVNSTPELLFQSAHVELTYTEYDYDGNPTDRQYTVTTEQTYAYAIPDSFERVELSAYEDIGDLTAADDFFYYIDERVYAESGAYTCKTRNTFTYDDVESAVVSNNTVTFDTYKSGFTMEDVCEYGIEGDEIHFRNVYEDGIMTFYETDPITGETYSYAYEYTEGDVRAMMAAAVLPDEIYVEDIIRIEALDEKAGKYRFHLGFSLEQEYREYFADMKGSMKRFEAYLDAVLTEDGLESFEYSILAEGFTQSNENHRVDIKVSCVFEEKTSIPTPV